MDWQDEQDPASLPPAPQAPSDLTGLWQAAFAGGPSEQAGYPQPTIDQIEAEDDTLNGQPPPEYSPVFGSYSPDEVERALETYGWRPEAAQSEASSVPVGTMRGDFGGVYYPGKPGRIFVNPDFAQDEQGRSGVPFTIQHEAEHQQDYGRALEAGVPSRPGGFASLGPNGRPDVGARSDLAALEGRTDYPMAAEAARAILHDPSNPRTEGGWAAGQNPLMSGDWDHLNHYLMNALDYDYGQIPPEMLARQFPFAAAGPSPATFERGMQHDEEGRAQALRLASLGPPETEEEQMARAQQQPYWGPEQIAAARRQWDATPWWLERNTYDPTAPPDVYGPWDTASESGGYVDPDTGEYVPLPRER